MTSVRRELSSRATRLFWVLPYVLLTAGVVGFWQSENPMYAIIPSAFGLVFALSQPPRIVTLDERSLTIESWNKRILVPLTAICEISERRGRSRSIEICFDRQTEFGRQILYIPNSDSDADDLRVWVDFAKRPG